MNKLFWRRIRPAVFAAFVLAASPGGALRAQDEAANTEPPAAYGQLIESAIREYATGNFAEARALFLKAHDLYPNARTQRGIGMTEFELKNYGECIARLEAALASTVRPLDVELRERVEALLLRARAYVAQYELRVEPEAQGLELRVNGRRIEPQAAQPLVLPIGEHVVEAEAPGYQPRQIVVRVRGGEADALVIELQVSAPVVAPKPEPQPPVHHDRSVLESPWLWAAAGGVVLGTGVALALVGLSDAESAKTRSSSAASPAAWDDAKTDYDAAKKLNTIGWVVAGAGAATTVIALAIGLGSRANESPSSALRVDPMVAPRSAGLIAHGKF